MTTLAHTHTGFHDHIDDINADDDNGVVSYTSGRPFLESVKAGHVYC